MRMRVSGVRRSCEIEAISRPRPRNSWPSRPAMVLKTRVASRTSTVPWRSSSCGTGWLWLSEWVSACEAETSRRTGADSQRAPNQAATPISTARMP
jgi:hypothetical protein